MKKKSWDLYAPVYKQAMKGDRKAYAFMYERIPEVIRNKDVLEIATGPGLLAKHVAGAAKSMIATDYSEGMIKEARKGSYPSNLTFEVADACRLPYRDGTFDVVIIANALHIMDDPHKALLEIRRVLKDDGILIAPNFVNHATGNPAWMAILKLAGVSFEHRWTTETYPKYLESEGWHVTFRKVIPARITVFYAECRKKA